MSFYPLELDRGGRLNFSRSLPSFFLLTMVAMTAGPGVQARMSADVLGNVFLARESHDRVFWAKLEAGHAQLEGERARFVYQLNARLIQRQAVSAFEYSTSIVRMLEARLKETRALSTAKDAEVLESLWNLRADWERKDENDVPERIQALSLNIQKTQIAVLKALARGQKVSEEQLEKLEADAANIEQAAARYAAWERIEKQAYWEGLSRHVVDLRRQQVDLIKKFITDAQIPERELAYQRNQTQRLLSTGAVSRDDYNAIDITYRDAAGLLAAARTELAEVESRLKDALEDAQMVLSLRR